jgi:hypothetical protein
MNRTLSVIAPLLAAGSARILADGGAYQIPTTPSSSILNPIYSFLVSVNPFILIILGVVVFLAGKLAKFVGVVLVMLGLVDLLLPYLLRAA